MKRKLWLLNAALVALLAYAGWQFRQAWRAAKAHEAAELGQKVKPVPPPPWTAPAKPGAVTPAGYADIAQQMLFDRSRNPNVVIEAPKPPPPKPMPPLPVYHGQMVFSDGPIVVMSETPTAAHQAVRRGESIGQFKLVDVNADEIALEWDGKTVRKKIDELLDRKAMEQANAAVASAAPVRTEAPTPAAEPPKPPKGGPGPDIGLSFRACEFNDPNPAGAIVDGFRKVLTPTPFGNMCRWDPVGR